MTAYADLATELDHLLTKSARFVRMAFHIHSPESYDWGERPGADPVLNARDQYLAGGEQAYLDRIAEHFDIVCITDHMRSHYACNLAREAKQRSDIVVFPGMEVNCVVSPVTRRVHLLVIFPPNKSVVEIDRIFSGHSEFPGEDRRTGQEDCQLPSLAAFTQSVRDQGGMLVIPHIDESSRGHRARFRAMRDETLRLFTSDDGGVPIEATREVSEEYRVLLADSGVDAIEIMNPQDRRHYVKLVGATGKSVRMPCLVRSDAHCIEQLAHRETVTYVKVSAKTFECVRDALRFFETRVRFKDDLPSEIPNRLVGIRFRSPDGSGLFTDTTIAFNPNLNAIIGPRGSGKSTVIEALRYVLGQNTDMMHQDDSNVDALDYRTLSQGIQTANLKNTIIEVIYEKHGHRHCLSTLYDPKDPSGADVFDIDGTPRMISPQAVATDYPARIYSWSQIENLGRLPSLQRRLLDTMVPTLAELNERRDELYRHLAENALTCERVVGQLNGQLAEDRGVLRRYLEYKADFERINTPEVAKLFETIDALRIRVKALGTARATLQSIVDKVEALPEIDPPSLETTWLADGGEAITSWWRGEIIPALELSLLADAWRKGRVGLTDELRRRVDAIREFEEPLAAELLQQETELRSRTHASADEELNATRREQARKRYENVTAQRQQYLRLLAELEIHLVDRQEFVDGLIVVQDAISLAPQQSQEDLATKLTDFCTADMQITASFRRAADRDDVVRHIRDSGMLSRETFGQYKQKEIVERCCIEATPVMIADAILRRDYRRLFTSADAVGAPERLSVEEAQSLVLHFHPLAFDDSAQAVIVDATKMRQVFKVQEIRWDDEVRILLNSEPVDKLSPGQRSSAMLPLVALSEDVPLIIDQPEDNLDNRHVGRVLTKILAELKERRQIILATHNPNIVVGGDAEQVIVLKPNGQRRAEVEQMASIDDSNIISAVIGLMEGGKEAFKIRERRYGVHLNS